MDVSRAMPSRRALIAGAAGLGVGGLILGRTALGEAATQPSGEPVPEVHHDVTKVAPQDLTPPSDAGARALAPGACGSTVYSHNEILSQPTYYEISGNPASFSYNSTLYSRLETWLTFYFNNTPIPFARPGQIWTYGCYVNRNDGCVSVHNTGRGFDLSRIYATDPATGTMNKVFNARYDQWKSTTGSSLTTTRKRYWAASASAHYHFKHVLTYLYNSAHHNHIHIDNSASGSGNSTFSTGSSAQVQHVQASCTYIWGRTLTLDGAWGPKTSAAAAAVMTRVGRTGNITSSQANWLEFNRATLRFGTGSQTY